MPSAQQRIDKYMRNKLGYSMQTRAAVIYYGAQFWEQVLAVVPITLCLVVAMAIYFQKTVASPAVLAGGLCAAMVGLVLFVDGLRVAIMPLGSMLGQRLPEKFKVRYILIVACAIGILCTYAEPAIASLRPLANLVKRCQTPYLYFVLNDLSEVLVLSIGLGVGVAAMIGVLRFLRGWSLKPLIATSLLPTIGCACYMKWGNTELAPLIGLAWDCGAVTTGPVTVPILLSLGIGVIKGQKARHAARELVDQQANSNHGQALEGFGVITLASMFPILAVEVMSIGISLRYSPEDIRTNFGTIDCATYVEEEKAETVSEATQILDAFIFAVRAIVPLNVFLILMIKIVLREDLPKLSFDVPMPLGLLADLDEEDGEADSDVEAGGADEKDDEGNDLRNKNVQEKLQERAKIKEAKQEERLRKRERLKTAIAGVNQEASDDEGQVDKVVRREITKDKSAAKIEMSSRSRGQSSGCCAAISNQMPLICGVLESMAGMTLFNIGLTYGFTALGDQAGLLLPAAFIETQDAEGSPYYEYYAGVAIVLSVVFSLGFLATRAEPALRVMGKTVETLSDGTFTQTALVYTVCVGVGFGMVAGSSKILFEVNIIFLILGKYSIAALLTVFSSENFTNIAWDSAGVTTGPVTVPFVLSVGIGFSKARNAQEGFGILTCASVAPIITVLFTDLLRRMIQSAVRSANARRRRNLRSEQTQTDTPEDVELLLGPPGKARGALDLPGHAVQSADAGTQYDPPLPLDTSEHQGALAKSISAALNGTLAVHQTPSTLDVTPMHGNGALVPRGARLGGTPLSARSRPAAVTTTITVTTNYVSPEDVSLFESHTAC